MRLATANRELKLKYDQKYNLSDFFVSFLYLISHLKQKLYLLLILFFPSHIVLQYFGAAQGGEAECPARAGGEGEAARGWEEQAGAGDIPGGGGVVPLHTPCCWQGTPSTRGCPHNDGGFAGAGPAPTGTCPCSPLPMSCRTSAVSLAHHLKNTKPPSSHLPTPVAASWCSTCPFLQLLFLSARFCFLLQQSKYGHSPGHNAWCFKC